MSDILKMIMMSNIELHHKIKEVNLQLQDLRDESKRRREEKIDEILKGK